MAYTLEMTTNVSLVNEEDTSEITRFRATYLENSLSATSLSFAVSGTTNREVAIAQFATIEYLIFKVASDATDNVLYHFTNLDAAEDAIAIPPGGVLVLPGASVDSQGTSYVDMSAAQTATIEIIITGLVV
jgi:hypothetical protein